MLSTYRLQLHAGFTFDHVREVIPYLAELGVTHLYLSPVTTAAPGSTHGYDVIDPTALNPELGGDEAYRRLVDAQREAGLGQVIDIVPNHMGIAPGSGNAYWEDVLRNGPDSEYADVFDVEWDTPPRGRVLLPILDAPLDEVIEHGDLEVDRAGDGLLVYGNRLPLRPGSLEEWDESQGVRDLAERQHYRLQYWRRAHDRLDYRRFFAIDELIGIHAEDPSVFELTHRLPLDLVRRGDVDGLRIDHIDGLRDPEEYLHRLRARLAEAGAPESYLVVEKILEADEPLPDWDCDGTTGYDVMNELIRVLVSPDHLERLDVLDRRVTGRANAYEEMAADGREHVVTDVLGGQFERLAARLYEALQPEEVTEHEFVDALLALLAHFSAYRTYHRRDALDEGAAHEVERAARAAAPLVPSAAIEAARDALARPPEGEAREVVLSLQQIMPAVQAKGIEDRVLFRFRRLMALNEVGGDPDAFGESVEVFHERMRAASERWPRRMLASATHDHKLGEDVRARLAVLAEVPDQWEGAVDAAFEILERIQRQRPALPRVHPADLYLLLQILVGASPEGMTLAPAEEGRAGDDDFAGRLEGYMVKALREAGERTDWIDEDEAYEGAVADLVRWAVADASLREALQPLMAVVVPAGAVNGLAQLVLKLGAPGVPDTYQGNELWDFSLVDPDNRRAVDFDLRAKRLAYVADATPEALLESWRDGSVKMRVLARALAARRARPELFLGGSYAPVAASGEHERHVIAYARRAEASAALVVAPRLSVQFTGGAPDLWHPAWGNTRLELPEGLEDASWRDVITGERVTPSDGRVSEILGRFPVALLLSEG